MYIIEWGDDNTEWTEYGDSGEEIKLKHTWKEKGTYTIRARAKDINDLKSDWGTLTVTMPRNRLLTSPLFMRLLQRFPNAFPILRHILKM